MQAPHLTVAAVIEQRGRFLMVEELVNGQRVINQPAGHVEPRETLLDAVVRETLEETAWRFHPSAICGAYLWQHPRTGVRFLRVAFCGNCDDHDATRALDEGIIRAVWFTRTELASRPSQLRSPMVLRSIDDYLAGVRYPAQMFQHLDLEELAGRAKVV